MGWDVDGLQHRGTRRGIRDGVVPQFAKMSDSDKRAYAEIEKYFRLVNIGEKSINGCSNKYAYKASMILLFLDEENRKAFLEYYPKNIEILKAEMKAYDSKANNVLSDARLSQIKSEKIAIATEEHNEAFSKCYPKASEIVEEQILNEDENAKAIRIGKKRIADKIEGIRKLAYVLADDHLRQINLGRIVNAIGRTYESHGFTSTRINAYTELVPAGKIKHGKFDTNGIRVMLYLSTDGKPSPTPVDIDLTSIYTAMVNTASVDEQKTKFGK